MGCGILDALAISEPDDTSKDDRRMRSSAADAWHWNSAPEFKGKAWTSSYLESLSIISEYFEAHHPNRNLADKRSGGVLKATTSRGTLVGGNWCPFGVLAGALHFSICA